MFVDHEITSKIFLFYWSNGPAFERKDVATSGISMYHLYLISGVMLGNVKWMKVNLMWNNLFLGGKSHKLKGVIIAQEKESLSLKKGLWKWRLIEYSSYSCCWSNLQVKWTLFYWLNDPWKRSYYRSFIALKGGNLTLTHSSYFNYLSVKLMLTYQKWLLLQLVQIFLLSNGL